MTTIPTLHFMCGKAGAGKSTLAQTIASDQDALLLCEDIWLARLFPEELASFEDYIKYSRRLKTVIAPLVTELLKTQSVVLDFPANTINTRAWFRSIFEGAAAPHLLHFVDVCDRQCLKQIAQRNLDRPEGSHELSEAMFHHISSFFQPPSPEEGFNVRVYGQPLID